MKEVGKAVQQNAERAAPRQIALFSNCWTPQLDMFKKEYMTSPVTIITNKIEAAIACNVKQVDYTHLVTFYQLYTYLDDVV